MCRTEKLRGNTNAKGHMVTDAHKIKLSIINSGPKSEETKKKMSEAHIGKTKYSKEMAEEIIKLFNEGITKTELAKRYDLCYVTILKVFKRHKV
jgi:hypothetical protein